MPCLWILLYSTFHFYSFVSTALASLYKNTKDYLDHVYISLCKFQPIVSSLWLKNDTVLVNVASTWLLSVSAEIGAS